MPDPIRHPATARLSGK